MNEDLLMIKKKPELLLPAGGPDTLDAALQYGADAVSDHHRTSIPSQIIFSAISVMVMYIHT